MKKSSLLALAFAPLVLTAPLASYAQDAVTTDPVGYVKLDIQPGLQTLGVSLVRPADASGSVASASTTSITLAGERDLSTDLSAGTAYYLEVTSGSGLAPWTGERFEVDVNATRAAASNVVTINSGSSRNTSVLGDVAGELTGYNVVIRPHVTLSQVFPTSELALGDQVLIFQRATGGFDTYTLQEDFLDGIIWSGSGANQNNLVIAPGQGVFFRRGAGAGSVSLTTVVGEVRTNNFRQPLLSGLNHVAEGHPVDNSPNSRVMTQENGFDLGDAILVFNPTTGGFVTYVLSEDFLEGVIWSNNGSHNNSLLFDPAASVFVRKSTGADLNYEAPVTF